MTTDPTTPANRRASALSTLIPLSIATIGLGLLGYMVATEGEPGGIPLLLIVVGVGWFAVARFRDRQR